MCQYKHVDETKDRLRCTYLLLQQILAVLVIAGSLGFNSLHALHLMFELLVVGGLLLHQTDDGGGGNLELGSGSHCDSAYDLSVNNLFCLHMSCFESSRRRSTKQTPLRMLPNWSSRVLRQSQGSGGRTSCSGRKAMAQT